MTKKIAAIALFAVTSLVTVARASAQAPSVRATIPFEFTVGNQVLPAGAYTITHQTPHQILIASKDGANSMYAMANAGDNTSEERPGKLLFQKAGDRYRLTQIVTSSPSTSVVFVSPKRAKKDMENAGLEGDIRTVIATN